MLTIGSLFSGIGGLELGLEWALGEAGIAHRVAWQVEIDPFARRILERHWPEADRSVCDVRAVDVSSVPGVDILCGGFPCEDLSQASHGRGMGLDGPGSGLWREFRRIIGEIDPWITVIENVGGNASARWLPTVRRDLHMLGRRTRAVRLDARDVGAPHARARIFVVAHSDRDREPTVPVDAQASGVRAPAKIGGHWRETEPRTFRVDDGVSGGVDRDRLRVLGKAVVPQVAHALGRMVIVPMLMGVP